MCQEIARAAHSFKKVERLSAMSSLWKTIREFRTNSKCPTYSQTKSQSSSADSSTTLPADHEPRNYQETCGIVDADVKADDDCDENFDHQNNIVPIALSTSWSDISLGSFGNVSFDENENYNEAQRLMEKDAILAEKDAILAEKDKILAEKDEILAEKEREIKILRQTASEYWRTVHDDQQEKFRALYFHACNLAEDREALIEGEEKKKDIIKQQKKLIKQLYDRIATLVHEDNLEHLARQQSVTTYSSSDTASVSSSRHSVDKNSMSEMNMNTRRQEESHGISRMMHTVPQQGLA
jgi:hypothetical protein